MKNCAGFCVRRKLCKLKFMFTYRARTDERMLLITLRVPAFVGLTLGLIRLLFFRFLTNGRQSEHLRKENDDLKRRLEDLKKEKLSLSRPRCRNRPCHSFGSHLDELASS